MTSSAHDHASALAAEAGAAASRREWTRARSLYAQAAEHEALALRDVPDDKPRTRSILSVSLVALLYKAAQYEAAEHAVHVALADQRLLGFARRQLRELLEVIFDEQSIPAGYRYSGDELVFTMRGSEVGHGTAPFDLVLDTGTSAKNFLTRVVEHEGDFPFRPSGGVPHEVLGALSARATQPQASSYKFSLRIVEPEQRDLFEAPRIDAKQTVGTALNVIRLANTGTKAAHESLCELVPDERYRSAMLRLVRNLAPTSRGLREVEVTRRDTEAGDVEVVLLGPGSVERVRESLRLDAPPEAAPEPLTTFRGVLRALHLDRRWLELVDGASKAAVRFRTPADALDDVIGPMVNRAVVVRARKPRKTRKSSVLELVDIELEDPS